jgi:hypothetical protein
MPRHSADLTAPDVSELEKIHGYDDASIMSAKYLLEDRFSDVKVERSNQMKPLKKNHILKAIAALLKHTQKDGSMCHLPCYVYAFLWVLPRLMISSWLFTCSDV